MIVPFLTAAAKSFVAQREHFDAQLRHPARLALVSRASGV